MFLEHEIAPQALAVPKRRVEDLPVAILLAPRDRIVATADSQATIVSTHATVAEAYAALDRIGEKLYQDEAPEGTLEIYVVDEGRQPVPRPGAQ